MPNSAPADLDPIYQAAGREWNVDPLLLRAVAGQESGGTSNPDLARSPKGAGGRMQLMPGTAQGMGVTDTSDPAQNIYGGAKYLSQQLDKYGNPEMALAAYNAGPDRVDNYRAGKATLPDETAAYVPGVTQRYHALAAAQQPPGATPAAAPGPSQAMNTTPPAGAASRSSAAPAPASDPFNMAWQAAQAASASPANANPSKSGTAGAPTPPADPFTAAWQAAQAASPSSADGPATLASAQATPAASAPTPAPPASPSPASNPNAPPSSYPATFNAGGRQIPNPAAGYASVGNALTSPGILRGISDVGDTLARGVDAASQWVDDRVPFMGRLDQTTGQTPAANVAAMDRDRDAYQQQHGADPSSQVGRMVGQAAATLPIMGLGGRLAAGAGNALADAAGPLANPLRTVGSFLTGSTATNPLARMASQATSGAIQGGTGAALVSGQSDQPFTQQVANGIKAGGLVGAAAPLAGNVVRGAANVLTGAGGAVSAGDAQLAQLARDKYGIAVRGGQISSSPIVRGVDATLPEVPFSGQAAANAQQQGQFTAAVARTIGAPPGTSQITPSVMTAARSQLGNTFDNIARQTTVRADAPFLDDLARIETEAPQTLAASEVTPIRTQMDNVLSKVQTGDTISGDAYQSLTRKGAPLDRAEQSIDPNVRFYAGQVRDALDDAMERSIPPGSTTLADLQQARLQWKNMRTIQPLVVKGEPGEISPASLEGAVNQSFKDRAFARPNGQDAAGDLGELASIGKRFLAPALGNSGTAMRGTVMNTLRGGGLVGAGAAGYADPANLLYAAGGLLGSATAARGAGSYLRSNFYTNNLINSGLPGAVPTGTNALLNSLAGAGPYLAPAAGIASNPLISRPRNRLAGP